MNNPLVSRFSTPYQLPPFDLIENDHYLTAIELSLKEAKEEIKYIEKNEEKPTFINTIEALEQAGEKLSRNASILFNLNSAETNEEIQKITQQVSPLISAFNSEVKQNPHLFKKVKEVYQARNSHHLNSEQLRLLDVTYLDFIRRGAELDAEKQQRFKEITIELSQLSLKYSENLLAETNDYQLIIEDENDLSGLPEDVKERAKSLAIQNGKESAWIFTLQQPSYIPFMEYAENRPLREKLFKAFMSKCFKNNDNDNQDIVIKTIRLKAEMANLLGYESFAKYVLEERMAEKPDNVKEFLYELLEKSLPKAKEEVEEIKLFMVENGYDFELERWDWAYFSEKLKKERYAFDDEIVKPFFKLENVIEGVFKTAEKLFDISFKENDAFPKYHEEVIAYEVFDKTNKVIATFYADFFPRSGKRSGAWMTSFRGQSIKDGEREIPQVSIVCNFTPSSEGKPSLLKFDEVLTLFHEFGHALHGMLADTQYQSLSGTNVFWDFVELPSQIMENWCYEKGCLELFAKHFETGEIISSDMIEKLRSSATYHEAYATVRQISFGLLDLAWHDITLDQANEINNVASYETESMASTDLFPKVEGSNMSVQFAHIFAGGYAAGYYSYKWAEVLDADAFSLFQQNGIFDKTTADSFKENILSKGGTKHPMSLYEAFRGEKPKINPLLKRAGLV